MVGERYHAPLTRIFNAIGLDDRLLPPPLTLPLALDSIGDNVRADGTLPSLLAYGQLPLFPGHEPNPTQETRKSTVTAALAEAAQAECEARINYALHTQVAPAACTDLKHGQKVIIY